ncbi:RagB/SusD family nutrient uptake outer membrane protein [uncultured Polaribacter sp.]|uniref:RagB/SusD family nutrient uptake outer membrane protein n=1 Tax=uncultured Polaribacter sp. TaxID=174711 RepID=UPI0026105E93|nr:RagB/SusD family nutrient uptake outer membrane protein [uncultured Polaribacter sp.]
MKKIIYNRIVLTCFSIILIFTACDDEYLSKIDESDISEEDIFSNFYNYQGFTNRLYPYIMDYKNIIFASSWCWGNETVSTATDLNRFSNDGDYFNILNSARAPIIDNSEKTNPVVGGVWTHGWRGVRGANQILANLDLMVDATDDERNVIEAQGYFLRAWFYFEFASWFGGMPYVETYLQPDDDLFIPRLNYQQTADKIGEDLEKAIPKLPKSWNEAPYGQATLGDANEPMATRGAAYAILAKNYLYAGSPLMNLESQGSATYNNDYLNKCIAACVGVFNLVNEGYYRLYDFDDYSYLFVNSKNLGVPAATGEKIWGAAHKNNTFNTKRSTVFNSVGGSNNYNAPTANFVENYEMANGLPIDDPASGYDPNNPWKNRDPRFYESIIIDNDSISIKQTKRAELYVGGREKAKDADTGYGQRKWNPIGLTNLDGWYQRRAFYTTARIRLADVYLMYAEAVNEVYGPNVVPTAINGATMTAVAAINVIRNRATMPNVNPKFLSSKEVFRERIWNERKIELAFEGESWFDIRRWYVAHLPEYKEMYALDFDENYTFFNKRLIKTRVFDQKHYWLPFPVDQVSIYPEWTQNPGW